MVELGLIDYLRITKFCTLLLFFNICNVIKNMYGLES